MYVQLVFTFALITIGTVAVDLKRGDPCITPNQENAACVPFKNCEILTKAVSTFHPDAVKFAQDSQCGFEKEEGLVCCGTSAFPKVNINLLFTPRPIITPAPPPEIEELENITLSTVSDESICGLEANPSFRIKGGRIALLEEFPWLVAVEYKSKFDNTNQGIRCGGSLINDQFVLTAAHCIVHIEFVITKAWLGANNISSDNNCLNLTGNVQCVNSTLKINVEKAYPHELYNSSHGYNDIGLLKLENKIEFTYYIRPICLPSPDLPASNVGIRLMVAGWGVTQHHRSSTIKLKVDVPIQSDSICNDLLVTEEREVTAGQLCAGGEKGKDSCQGDSGGPLIRDYRNANQKIQWYQEGIVSYGVGCGIQGRPAVYTRVSRYISWIISKTEKPKTGTFFVGRPAICELRVRRAVTDEEYINVKDLGIDIKRWFEVCGVFG